MPRLTREESKRRTRARLLEAAKALFKENGYSATSLEQIAEAVGVTKGAIYGHFANKEELLLAAIEESTTPDYAAQLNDSRLPLARRLEEVGVALAREPVTRDAANLAVVLEFSAALLRNPAALARFGDDTRRRLSGLAAGDADEPSPGTTPLESWVIGYALFLGLQLYQFVLPDIVTPELFGKAFALLAGLYPVGEGDASAD